MHWLPLLAAVLLAGSSSSFVLASPAAAVPTAPTNLTATAAGDQEGLVMPPSLATGSPPQQVHWRDRLCYGFPGCPDSYLFLVPTLVGLVVGGAQSTRKKKGVDATWLAAAVLASFIGTAVLMQISPLKVIIYLLVPLAVGVFWWMWRRG